MQTSSCAWPWSRKPLELLSLAVAAEMLCNGNYCITLKFGLRLRSMAAEPHVKFKSDTKFLNLISRLRDSAWPCDKSPNGFLGAYPWTGVKRPYEAQTSTADMSEFSGSGVSKHAFIVLGSLTLTPVTPGVCSKAMGLLVSDCRCMLTLNRIILHSYIWQIGNYPKWFW